MTVSMLRGCVFAAVLLASVPAHAYTPGSGDVDEDGRLTTRDALLIAESLYWPELSRLHAFRGACDITADGLCDFNDVFAIFGRTVTNDNDWDGDGVSNNADCAPLDHRIATPHTYYLDLDRDQLGNPEQPIQTCSVSPEAPLALWNGDTAPSSVHPAPVHLPKGARILSLDFGDVPEDGRLRVDLAKDLGIDATPMRLPWSALESSPGVFTGVLDTTMNYASGLKSEHGLGVSLTISPISGSALTVPGDLRTAIESGTVRFNNPLVIDRFKNLLSAVRARNGAATVVSLQLGHEIDRFLVLTPDYFWDDYAEFIAAVIGHARQLWPGIKVGTTATLLGLVVEPSASRLARINAAADMVSLTYVLRGAESRVVEPTEVRTHIGSVVGAYYPKPLYIQAAGYPSSPATGSSETKQSQFITAMFEVWDQWPTLIPFVSFERLHDFSPERAQWEGQYTGGAASAAYVQSQGLRSFDDAGRAKSGYQTLRNLALNRGWFSGELPHTRSFRMGFTPSPYDRPAPADYPQMLAWLNGKLTVDADIVNLHLDAGVPWVEALADTFASAELPYSPALKALWHGARDQMPPGHKRVVSLNPSGIPRSILAPYFGYGEGFIYDDQFNRIGTGVFADMGERLPPAPWNTFGLNHPAVKAAFVNYCKRAIDFFDPDYLIVAIETTAIMLEGSEPFDAYLELQRHVYQTLKADPRYRHVPILVSVSSTSFLRDEFGIPLKVEELPGRMRDLQVQGLIDVMPYVDMVALSLYPHYGRNNSNLIQGSMYDKVLEILAAAGKPVAVSENGWVAESFDLLGFPFVSSEEKQDLFYRHLFTEFGRSPVPVEFIVNFQLRDNDRLWERLRQDSLLTPPKVSPMFVEFYKYFRDIGIYDGDGNERQAGRTWKQMLAVPFTPPQN